MPKVINLRDTGGKVPDGAVRIDRKTKWGNPFVIGQHFDRARVIELYRTMRAGCWSPKQLEEMRAELRGKDLACWCAPLPCHGDVLMEMANRNEMPAVSK